MTLKQLARDLAKQINIWHAHCEGWDRELSRAYKARLAGDPDPFKDGSEQLNTGFWFSEYFDNSDYGIDWDPETNTVYSRALGASLVSLFVYNHLDQDYVTSFGNRTIDNLACYFVSRADLSNVTKLTTAINAILESFCGDFADYLNQHNRALGRSQLVKFLANNLTAENVLDYCRGDQDLFFKLSCELAIKNHFVIIVSK